jgi:transcriptional regulator with XRE-family HTH domain
MFDLTTDQKVVLFLQSNISRLESGSYNPSVQFLMKIAKAMGKELVITLK